MKMLKLTKDLIDLVRTPYENMATRIEDIIDFIFRQPAAARVKAVQDLFFYWPVPDRNEWKRKGAPSFSEQDFAGAERRLKDMIKSGEVKYCRHFHQEKPAHALYGRRGCP